MAQEATETAEPPPDLPTPVFTATATPTSEPSPISPTEMIEASPTEDTLPTTPPPEQTEILTPTEEFTAEVTQPIEVTVEATPEQVETITATPTSTVTESTPLSPEPTLMAVLSEAFHTQDLSRWSIGAGWALVPQEQGFALQVTDSDTPVISNVDVFADVAVEMIFQTETGTLNLHLRQTETDSYTLAIHPDGQVDLYHGTILLATTHVDPVTLDQWRHVRFSAIGDTLRVAIDSEEVLALRDASPLLVAGHIAFKAGFPQQLDNSGQQNVLLVDNIRIWVPDQPLTLTNTPTSTPGQGISLPDGTLVHDSYIVGSLYNNEMISTPSDIELGASTLPANPIFVQFFDDNPPSDPQYIIDDNYIISGTPVTGVGYCSNATPPDQACAQYLQGYAVPTDLELVVRMLIGDDPNATYTVDNYGFVWSFARYPSITFSKTVLTEFIDTSGVVLYRETCLWTSSSYDCSTDTTLPYTDLFVQDIPGVTEMKISVSLNNQIPSTNLEYYFLSIDNIFIATINPIQPTPTQPPDSAPPGILVSVPPIVFANSFGGDSEIYKASSLSYTQLTDNSFEDTNPAYSPDGQQVVFQSDRDGTWEIYRINIDGTAELSLTTNGGIEPDWYPDGSAIVFARGNELYRINSDGTGETQLTNHGSGEAHDPTVSNDGNWVIYEHDGDLHIIDGTCITSCTPTLLQSGGTNSLPAWSPDGSQLAWSSADDLYTATVDYSGATPLLVGITELTEANSAQVDTHPTWARDGKSIFFESNRNGETSLFEYDLGGGASASSAASANSSIVFQQQDPTPTPEPNPNEVVRNGGDAHQLATESLSTAPEGIYTVNSDSPLTTNSGDGVCTLTDAILYINGEGVDQSTDCNLATGSSGYTIEFDTERTVTIDSPYAGINGLPIITADVTIDGKGSTIARGSEATAFFRFFEVPTGKTLVLKNLTLTGGHVEGNGGAILSNGDLTLSNSAIISNYATGNGGGIYNTGSSILIIQDTLIQDNTAGVQAGSIYHESTVAANVTSSCIVDNTSTQDGSSIFVTASSVSASNNWWGDPSGPRQLGGNITSGDIVGGNISFSPLPEPPHSKIDGVLQVCHQPVTFTNLDFYDTHQELQGVMFWVIFVETSSDSVISGSPADSDVMPAFADFLFDAPYCIRGINPPSNNAAPAPEPFLMGIPPDPTDPNPIGISSYIQHCLEDHRSMYAQTMMNGFLSHERRGEPPFVYVTTNNSEAIKRENDLWTITPCQMNEADETYQMAFDNGNGADWLHFYMQCIGTNPQVNLNLFNADRARRAYEHTILPQIQIAIADFYLQATADPTNGAIGNLDANFDGKTIFSCVGFCQKLVMDAEGNIVAGDQIITFTGADIPLGSVWFQGANVTQQDIYDAYSRHIQNVDNIDLVTYIPAASAVLQPVLRLNLDSGSGNLLGYSWSTRVYQRNVPFTGNPIHIPRYTD